jgi:hypothetical protein
VIFMGTLEALKMAVIPSEVEESRCGISR